MVDAMIAIAEDLRQTFSREADAVENLAAHAVAGSVLERDGDGTAHTLLNKLYLYHITQI